jgi:hypothetical protein
MMPETATQFVARVTGILPAEPPVPRRGLRHGSSSKCWLCGGDTGGVGWPIKAALGAAFTQHNIAAVMDSDAWCQACVATTKCEPWQAMVKSRGLDLKIWTQAGWNTYSHFVREDGHYSSPTRREMRAVLLDPPAGQWVLGINTSGQKHTIFRATVAANRDYFPVQFDEYTVWLYAERLRSCLADFERLCELGFSKDSILSGRYHHGQMLKVGIARWTAAEEMIAAWRASDPDMLAVVHFVALGPAHF